MGRRLVDLLPVAQRTNAFTIGIDGRTRVRIPLRTFLFEELLARASYYKHVSQGPQDLDRSLGRHVRPYTETRQRIRPKDPAVPRGENVIRFTPRYSGLGNRSIFYPGSSVGSTITFRVVGRTRVRIPLRTFPLEEMLARASHYRHVSLGPQDLDRSLGT